jgi:nicotinate phosphoribosyltransferase
VRQDSGDPLRFVDAVAAHYRSLGIDPLTKTIVFSDSLDVEKALAIHRHCGGKIRDSYGIGTHLTNDVGVTPLNMVVKMIRCRTGPEGDWQGTVKLSDDPGKRTGSPDAVKRCLAELFPGPG